MSRFDNIIVVDGVSKTATQTSGTELIDLPEAGWLSQINLRAGTNTAWVNESVLHNWMSMTKIEVLVNGSTPIKTYNARQLRALWWYHGMELPPLGTYGRGGVGDLNVWSYPILFGNYVGDLKHMLHLDDYANPQLRITWDAAQATFDGVSRNVFASPTFTYGVDAIIQREAGATPPVGYVKSTEIDTWTTGNNVTHTTEIPRGDELIGLMIGGRYDDIPTPEFFDNIKLDFDNGKWVALNHGLQQLLAFYSTWFSRVCHTSIWESVASADTPDPMLGFVDGISVDDGSGNIGSIEHAGFDYPLYDLILRNVEDGLELTGKLDVYLNYLGRLPHQCYYIPMHAFTGEKWVGIDTKDYGRIDLKTKMGSGVGSDATERVVAEYIVPTGK